MNRPRWLALALLRIKALAVSRKVRFTIKALRELAALEMEFDEEDACDVLVALEEREFDKRVRAETTGEWMYVFKPEVGGVRMYIKIILRGECVVISFHEDEPRP